MREDNAFDTMERLGIFFVPKNRGNGWIVTMPGEEGRVMRYKNSDALVTWIYSWAAAELPEYLAIAHFESMLDSADTRLIEDLRQWFMKELVTERVVKVRDEVYNILRYHFKKRDSSILYANVDMLGKVLERRIGLPYHSLWQRLSIVFEEHVRARNHSC